MKEIVVDENFNIVDELEERNTEIKENLFEILEEFREEKLANRALKIKEKLGYRFAKQLYLELAKYPPMSADKFARLDYETLNYFWLNYLSLTAHYNRYFEIVDNKQLFCAYTGLNTRQYSQLEKSDDEDIRNLMNSINSAFVGLGFVAAESGNADVKGVNQRLRASNEAGHSMMTATEEKVIEKTDGLSEREFAKSLENLGIKVEGLLNDGK